MQNDKYLPPQTTGYQAPPASYPAPGYPPQGYPAQSYQSPPPSAPQNYGLPPTQNYIPPTTQVPPATIVVTSDGWFSRNNRNKPQSNAVAAAGLIFISGGMNIAYSIGFRSLFTWVLPQHTRCAWFTGAIIGAVLGGFLTNKVPKKILLYFCGVLVMIGGIVMASTFNSLNAIEAALYLDGIANGLLFAPTLALAGEVSVPYLRGTLTASTDQLCYATGYFIQIMYTTSWSTSSSSNSSFGAQQMHGVLSAVYGLISLVLTTFLTIESPVILLANGQEHQAIDALRRLQRPQAITTETYTQLEEHKRYLALNKDMSTIQSLMQGFPALIKLVYFHILNAMGLSSFVYFTLTISIPNNWSIDDILWQFMVFAFCRWIGCLCATFLMESSGRKVQTLFGVMVAGGLAIGIGTLIYGGPYDTIFPLLSAFQVFAGIAFTSSSPYLSEAFPLRVKQHYIGVVFIIENLIYIIILCCDFTLKTGRAYFIFLGVLYLLAFVAGIFILPETRRTTLREAQIKFKSILSRGFN